MTYLRSDGIERTAPRPFSTPTDGLFGFESVSVGSSRFQYPFIPLTADGNVVRDLSGAGGGQ